MKELKNIFDKAVTLNQPKGSSVYFLLRGGALVYIGKSDSLFSRLGSHSKTKNFDSVKVISVDKSEQDLLEMALIKTFRPEYNIQQVSLITEEEKAILKKFSIKENVLTGIIKQLKTVDPVNHSYGAVGYFSNGEFKIGYFDDVHLPECLDEHDETCEYANIVEAFENNKKEMSDETHEEICDLCKCQGWALVYKDSLSIGSSMMEFNQIYDLTDNPAFNECIDEFAETFIPGITESFKNFKIEQDTGGKNERT